MQTQPHPVLAALLALDRASAQLDELRLRVTAAADDVAAEDGARDIAAWLAHNDRLDRGQARRDLRLARSLDARWHRVARALREATVNRSQVEVIVRALDDLPEGLDRDLKAQAEERLLAEAARFGPRQLRILGRRILDLVAPGETEGAERRALEREEAHASRVTFLTTRRRGDGTTDIGIRVADLVADRLLAYLAAFTSPDRARATAAPTTRSSATHSPRSSRPPTPPGCPCTAATPPR